MDSGPEFTIRVLDSWALPGLESRWELFSVKSDARFRDQCLKQDGFVSLEDALRQSEHISTISKLTED